MERSRFSVWWDVAGWDGGAEAALLVLLVVDVDAERGSAVIR